MIVRICKDRTRCSYASNCPWNYGIDENCLKYFKTKKDQARVKTYYSRAFLPDIDGLSFAIPRSKLKNCPSNGTLCLDTIRDIV